MSKEMSDPQAIHAENFGVEAVVQATVGTDTTVQAKQGAQTEHELTAIEAIRRYPRALMWCVMVSMCVVMEGYDTNLLSNFYAYPAFARQYGTYNEATDNYQLSAAWQAGLGNAAGIGAFFGTLLNGYLVGKWGHVRVLIGALVALSCFVFIVFFAPNTTVMLIGQLFCGVPWGIFATVAPAYASKFYPWFLGYTNICFIIGQLISAGVMAGLVNNTTVWAYRIPFAIQWFWPVVLIPVLYFAPDTPWHLVRVDREDDAVKSLRRLRPTATEEEIREMLGLIIYTNKLEEELSVGTSYWDCFKGDELRRTEIACVCFAGQIFSGLNFAYNSTYFFQQVGLDSQTTYYLNVGGNSMALFACLISWVAIMPYVGRRTAYVCGMFAMGCILYTIGALNARTHNDTIGMTQAVLTLVWTFTFQLSAGQLGWALPAEIGSTRPRQKTICLARNAYSVFGVIAGVLQPYFMNPTEWNLRGYTGFFWGSTAFLVFVWSYFRLPETKDRTFEELDLLFAKKVPARKFKSYHIEAFGNDDTIHKLNTEVSQV